MSGECGFTPRAKGYFIAVSGVLFLSPAPLLIRLIELDHWTIVFFQGILMGLALAAFSALNWRETRSFLTAVGPMVLATGFFAADHLLFVLAITRTTVASALVILSTAPLFAALMSRVFLAESIERRTWLAILVCVIGVATVFSGAPHILELQGNLAALGAAVSIAGALVALRAGRLADMVPAVGLGGLLASFGAAPMADVVAVNARQLMLLVILGLFVLPLAFGLIARGPRYLPAPEVSLIMLLEAGLGPIWVWMVLSEVPSAQTFLGGGIVIGTLVMHSLAGMRQGFRSEIS